MEELRYGSEQVHALRGISLRIQRNEYVAIMGPSGSGKSTLMNLIGCLDSPTKGQYWLNGQLVSELDDDELARIRNKEIGFVFQTFNLLGTLFRRNSGIDQGQFHVVQRRGTCQQIEGLEDKPDFLVANAGQFVVV